MKEYKFTVVDNSGEEHSTTASSIKDALDTLNNWNDGDPYTVFDIYMVEDVNTGEVVELSPCGGCPHTNGWALPGGQCEVCGGVVA